MRRMTFIALTAALGACSGGREEAAEAAIGTPPDAVAPAAATPDTEIFIAPLAWTNGAPSLGEIQNATNHPGYDNQPWFLPGEAAFYFVQMGESGKTDIFVHDIARGMSRSVFPATPERSEFSPRRTPDGEHVSYIHEDDDAGDLTRVHKRPLSGGDGAAVVEFSPLGYYAWLDGGAALAVYQRTEPGSLHRVDVETGTTALLHDNIGRALQADEAGARLWFTALPPPAEDAGAEPAAPTGPITVLRYDEAGGAVTRLFDLPGAAQDFAVVFDAAGATAGVFAADGGTLYFRPLGADEDWAAAGDLAAAGVANATRIAVSDDLRWIAVVGEIAAP